MTEINWKDNLRIAWFGNFSDRSQYFFWLYLLCPSSWKI